MASTMRVAFAASEYQADASIRPAAYTIAGSPEDGWEIVREGRAHLRLGPGYRLLQASHCGLCSTDLVRRHLPFPLPQVTGHEVVALGEHGEAVVVEINASHAARRLARAEWCAFCRSDLCTHCPERLVLGIHDLPGGFSPWLLAPIGNVLPVPAALSPATAMLAEPFAAALHAVQSLGLRDGDRIAVLGPRRLGALMIAALVAWRQRTGRRIEILAVARRPEMRALATDLGADDSIDVASARARPHLAQVVVDTTGSPDGLGLALELATREVHVKSTTGQPTLGLANLTELVVDELAVVPWNDADPVATSLPAPPLRVAAVLSDVPAHVARTLEARAIRVVTGDTPGALALALERDPTVPLGAADLAVVTSLAAVDEAIRPRAGHERGLVRARGVIAVVDSGQPRDALLTALLDKRLRIGTTRCGDLRAALDVLADPTTGLAERLGERLVTSRVAAVRLEDAFARATDPAIIKVAVTHPDGLL
jgi:threonine dehydrogenase-like Zn-dependent dehydrogenase